MGLCGLLGVVPPAVVARLSTPVGGVRSPDADETSEKLERHAIKSIGKSGLSKVFKTRYSLRKV